MSEQVTITLKQIKARTTSQSFSRGEKYYQDGAISECTQRGSEIEGLCEGSYANTYSVSVRFDETGIRETRCNCEYDYGGDCKHIVALLLTYLKTPEAFEQYESRNNILKEREQDELIDLIEKMVNRHPDLRELIDNSAPLPVDEQTNLIDTQRFSKQLSRAFNLFGDWESDHRLGDSLYEIMETANDYLKKGERPNAIAIYCTILEECNKFDPYEFGETDDDYFSAVQEVTYHLRQECVFLTENHADLRQRVLDALVGAFIQDIRLGGVDYAADAKDIILEIACSEDIDGIRDQIQAAQKHKRNNGWSDWTKEAFESFLADLDILASPSPEETLKRLRKEGLYRLLVIKLLELKRKDEAITVIQQHITEPYALMEVLYPLMRYDPVKALQLADERTKRRYDERLIDWLIQAYQTTDQPEQALQWMIKRIHHTPVLNHYQSLKELAQTLGTWLNIRAKILKDITQQAAVEVLALIYLEDEEWESAWQALSKCSNPSDYYYQGTSYVQLDLLVAQKCGRLHPEQAISIFIAHAHKEIDQRNRKNYALAAEYFCEVRDLYMQISQAQEWVILLNKIHTKYKTLRALQDELKKAGL